MKLRANLVKSNLKKDPDSFGWSLDLHMKEIPSIYNLIDFVTPLELLNLDLSYNYLKLIESTFSSFSNLKWLDLSANHILKIENLDYLKNLEFLNLTTNSITIIENLDSLTSLKILDLSMNYIEKMQNLNLPNLESLNLTGNRITVLENLEGLVNMKEIDLSKNRLSDLSGLDIDGVCPCLFILKCNYNHIEYQYLNKLIQILKKFDQLEEIEFIGNELTLNNKYRFLFSEIKTLKIMDSNPITAFKKEHLNQIKLEEQLQILQERVQEEYLNRIRDEHENKMNYKNLIDQRKKYVEDVFEDHEVLYNKDLHDFLEFSSQVKKKKPEEIKPEVLKKWRENILTNEKERDRLTKIALKQQEELKQNFLMSKLQATKLTQKLYEISMNQPDVWKDIKKKELEQIQKEENEQIKKDRDIPQEENEENEDDLMDALEEEFKHDVANILSDKIRDIQTKDLQKERAEAINVIKKSFKQLQKSPNTNSPKIMNNPNTKNPSKQLANQDKSLNNSLSKPLIKLQKAQDNTSENNENNDDNQLINAWKNLNNVDEGSSKLIEIKKTEQKTFDPTSDIMKIKKIETNESKLKSMLTEKPSKKDVNWKEKREQFMQKQKTVRKESKTLKQTPDVQKSKKCSIF